MDRVRDIRRFNSRYRFLNRTGSKIFVSFSSRYRFLNRTRSKIFVSFSSRQDLGAGAGRVYSLLGAGSALKKVRSRSR